VVVFVECMRGIVITARHRGVKGRVVWGGGVFGVLQIRFGLRALGKLPLIETDPPVEYCIWLDEVLASMLNCIACMIDC